jgi:hypothetical protein
MLNLTASAVGSEVTMPRHDKARRKATPPTAVVPAVTEGPAPTIAELLTRYTTTRSGRERAIARLDAVSAAEHPKGDAVHEAREAVAWARMSGADSRFLDANRTLIAAVRSLAPDALTVAVRVGPATVVVTRNHYVDELDHKDPARFVAAVVADRDIIATN